MGRPKNALIVYAHPEPNSFCGAMKEKAVSTLTSMGWSVEVSDLYAMNFNPVSGKNNFKQLKPGTEGHFKQNEQELWAGENNMFVDELRIEMEKVKKCDVLLFIFPMYWFSLPAILKGWVDRVFAMGSLYGKGAETVHANRKGLLCFTTGAPKDFIQKDLPAVLFHLHKGCFGFTGITPLHHQAAYAAAHCTDEQREAYLQAWEKRLRRDISKEKPLKM
eukprot:GCRY01002021.1.p1 GENE.GCRY01002021.1~~GCRY01002021.1.p1  ORF type:complete len:219 (+),score=20.02 GCRY01002021.1:144-800(+)